MTMPPQAAGRPGWTAADCGTPPSESLPAGNPRRRIGAGGLGLVDASPRLNPQGWANGSRIAFPAAGTRKGSIMSHRSVLICLAQLVALALPARSQGPLFRALELPIPPDAGSVVATADFDGDGDVDIITEGVPPSLFRNDGSGRFTRGPTFAGTPFSANLNSVVATGDFTGDGRPDVMFVGNPPASLILTVAVNGVMTTITPTTPATPPPGGTLGAFPTEATAADVDGDGDQDLAVAFAVSQVNHHTGPAQVRLWINVGGNVFVDATATNMPALVLTNSLGLFTLADVDLDGDADLVASDTYPGFVFSTRVARNNGSGVFTLAPAIPGAAPGSQAGAMAMTDLDGDGLPDLIGVAATGSSQEAIWRNLGNATFAAPLVTPIASPPIAYSAGDLDGLPGSEVLRFRVGTTEVARFVPGSGLAAPTQSFPMGISAYSRVTGLRDLDGDNDPDALVRGTTGFRVLFDTAGGVLVPTPTPRAGTAGYAGLQLGDVNADGRMDVLALELGATGYRLAVELNDGTGAFAAGAAATTPFGLGTFGAGQVAFHVFDADGDGDADAFVAPGLYSAGTGATSTGLLLRNIAGTFTAAGTVVLPPACRAVASGDLDGDGDLDLVVGATSPPASGGGTGPSYVVFNLGGGALSAAVALPASHFTSAISVFDADGDGDLDIVEANGGGFLPPTDASALFLNNGAGVFTASANLPAIPAITTLAADIDGDGDRDLILDGVILSNDGAGVFTQVAQLPTPLLGYFGSTVAAFDVDLDGDLDIVESGGSLYVNAGLGAFATPVPAANGQFGIDARAVADLDGDGDLDIAGPEIYFNTTRQLARGALARPGRVASLDVHGPAGAAWLLFASLGPASVAAPPYGTILIDPATTVLVTSGIFSPSGTATFSALAPAGPGAVGVSLTWQAFIVGPNRLTGRKVTTVTAY